MKRELLVSALVLAIAAAVITAVAGVTAEPALETLPSYATLEEAGVHGIQRDLACSAYYECGGVIARRPDGRFVVGPVVSDAQGDSVGIRYGVPAGWTLVADHHTHPCLDKNHLPSFFSPPDIEGVVQLRIIGFMGDLCTGDVHEFDPSKDSPNDTEAFDGVYLTHGRIIGHIAIDKTLVVEPNVGI